MAEVGKRRVHTETVSQVEIIGPLSAFGQMLMVQPTPTLQIQFQDGLNARKLTSRNTGSGATSVANRTLGQISTGTTLSSVSELRTRRVSKYYPGQGISAAFTGLFQSGGAANTEQMLGLGNIEDFLGFGFNGTAFSTIRLHGGKKKFENLEITAAATGTGNIAIVLDGDSKDVAVTSGDAIQEVVRKIVATDFTAVGTGWVAWNHGVNVMFESIDAAVHGGTYTAPAQQGVTGTFSNLVIGVVATADWVAQANWAPGLPSDIPLNTDKLTVFAVHGQYLGAGGLGWFIEHPTTHRPVLVDRRDLSGTLTITSLGNPSLPLCIIARNETSGSGTDLIIQSGSMAAFVEGLIVPEPIKNSKGATTVAISVSAEVPIITILVKHVFNSEGNRAEIQPTAFSFSGQGAGGNKNHTFRITTDAILSGPTAFTNIDTNTSIVAFDIASTGMSGGDAVVTIAGGKNIEEEIIRDLQDFIELQPPGATVTLSVQLDSGASTVGMSLFWDENQ